MQQHEPIEIRTGYATREDLSAYVDGFLKGKLWPHRWSPTTWQPLATRVCTRWWWKFWNYGVTGFIRRTISTPHRFRAPPAVAWRLHPDVLANPQCFKSRGGVPGQTPKGRNDPRH